MSDRDIPYEPTAKCDGCGHVGAYDFMGDYLCAACFRKSSEDDIAAGRVYSQEEVWREIENNTFREDAAARTQGEKP